MLSVHHTCIGALVQGAVICPGIQEGKPGSEGKTSSSWAPAGRRAQMNSNHTEAWVWDFAHGVQMRNGGPKRLCLAHGCSHSNSYPEIVKTAIK